MKKTLTTPVQLWHVIVVSFLVAVLTSTSVVSAAPMSAFLTQGTIRMAVVQSSTIQDVSTTGNTVVLQNAITVPVGKTADIVALGDVEIQDGALTGNQYCYVQYRLDNSTSGTQFKPGNMIVQGFNPPQNNMAVPANAYLVGVSAGVHTIYMVMQASYAHCFINTSTMILLVNLR